MRRRLAGPAAARRHPELLTIWKGRIETWTGERRGDTTEVFVYPSGWVCGEEPIVLRFVSSGSALKVSEASSACLDRS